MTKIDKTSFEYLGDDFQIRLLAQIVIDRKFGESIIDIIDPNYFKISSLKYIASAIKEAYKEYNIIPDIGSLGFRLRESSSSESILKFNMDYLDKIKDAELNDAIKVQEMGMRFCKTQELKKSISEIAHIISLDDDSKYDECEQILRKALEHGDNKDDGINALDNIDAVLAADYRDPIPTGIKGLDDIMDGGLSRGELGIVLAPFGVGKTTFLTKIANTAKNHGNNVLQIFFEDDKKQIQRKHLSCWSGVALNELPLHKDLIDKIVKEKNSEPGILRLKRFPSDGTTMTIIRKYVRKLIAQGFKPDMIILDYIDCVEPSKKVDDVNVGEGKVMREFETMLSEFDMAGWTAVQGNRSSITATIVEADQMGGSIKKAQIGHFLLSIAKTLEQKENNTASIAILKSRFGKSGLMIENIIFDNSKMQIEMRLTGNAITRAEYTENVTAESQRYINEALEKKLLQRKANLNRPTE